MTIQTLIEQIVFRPTKLEDNYVFKFDVDFEELYFYPEKGATINALHFKAKNTKGIILYFHGNKDNLVRWGKIASGLLRFQYDVMVIDYRGYGKSEGERTEENLYSDALFCYSKMIEKHSPKEIILYGRSLGTGIASWLAGKVNPTKLILETPYYDMHDLIGSFVPQVLYKNKLKLKFRSYSYLQKTNFPILILHGTSDRVVPYKSGKKLYESITRTGVLFYTIVGGSHNDLSNFPDYWNEVQNFLN